YVRWRKTRRSCASTSTKARKRTRCPLGEASRRELEQRNSDAPLGQANWHVGFGLFRAQEPVVPATLWDRARDAGGSSLQLLRIVSPWVAQFEPCCNTTPSAR